MTQRDDIKPNHYTCPVDLTLDVIGGKWRPLILWELRPGGKQFNALHARLPGISHKVLTQQLRRLVRQGILERTVRDGGVRTVTYTLTEFGRSLCPVLDTLAGWAKHNHRRMGLLLDWNPARR
jgi:DNA-binding HxlR family transcriptional regulator